MTSDEYMCGVCGLVLNQIIDKRTGDKIGFDHVRSADHIAVPINQKEVENVNYVCDFCMVPVSKGPYYTLPSETFSIGPNKVLVEDWLCCETCAVDITLNNWDTVLDRAIDAQSRQLGERFRPMIEGILIDLYEELRKHISGPIYQESR